jgi:hypothetical protein
VKVPGRRDLSRVNGGRREVKAPGVSTGRDLVSFERAKLSRDDERRRGVSRTTRFPQESRQAGSPSVQCYQRRGRAETPAPFSPTRDVRPITQLLVVTRRVVCRSGTRQSQHSPPLPDCRRPTCEQVTRCRSDTARFRSSPARVLSGSGLALGGRVTSVTCDFTDGPAREKRAREGLRAVLRAVPRLGRTRCGAVPCCRGCGAVLSRSNIPFVPDRVAVLSRSRMRSRSANLSKLPCWSRSVNLSKSLL